MSEKTTEVSRPFSLIDVFAGAGGFTLGFERAGFRSIFAVEADKDASATYNANFGEHCVSKPIEGLEDFPSADVVIGGPPCQGFSRLGNNNPDDPRNLLWKHFMRVVEHVQPSVFVCENVAPLLKSDQGVRILNMAADLGYVAKGYVLNAADFGVPQIRKRAIIIGSRVGELQLPQQTHEDPDVNPKKRMGLPPWRTVKDAIGNLPWEPTETNLHWKRNPTDLSMQRYQHIPPGGNRFNLPHDLTPPCWQKKTHGSTDLFGRLLWNRPSVTIRTEFHKPEKGRYLHPEAHRPITHREAARLQDFPDDFVFHGSRASIARQIGNAVPVGFSYAIALAVKNMLTSSAESLASEITLLSV